MHPDLTELQTELESIATTVNMPAGAMLFHCGDPAAGVFLVRQGSIRLTLDSAEGIFAPRTVGPGEILGLPAALTGEYSLSAQVVEDAQLRYVAAPQVNALLECSPRLCLLATRVMSTEIARMRAALREGIQIAHHH